MTDYEGIIFPLYANIIDRAVKEDKDVFVKFSSRKVESGMTLYLYETGEGGSRKIVGKARVKDTYRKTPSEVEENFSNRIFQSEEDFEEYVRGRRNKDMLVVETEDFERLDEPVETSEMITVAGLYLNKSKQKKLENKISGE